jgi:hypothetical protein
MKDFKGKTARIIKLRTELAAKHEELERLVGQYIGLNPRVPWRKLAARINTDHTQLHKFAKKRGLLWRSAESNNQNLQG